MCLIPCHVRINRTPSSPGVPRGPRHHNGTHRSTMRCHWTGRAEARIDTNTEDADEGGTVLTAHSGNIDGVQQSRTHHQPAAADHRPVGEAIPDYAVRSYRVGALDISSDERPRRSHDVASRTRNSWRTLAGVGGHGFGRKTIWGGSLHCAEAGSERPDVSSKSCPGCSQSSGRQSPEICPLSGLLKIRSNSVERLDWLTPDGKARQGWQLSWWTLDDAVRIQPPEGSSLRPDFATCPGGRNDTAGRPSSFYTTPGCSMWRPWPCSHRRTNKVGD